MDSGAPLRRGRYDAGRGGPTHPSRPQKSPGRGRGVSGIFRDEQDYVESSVKLSSGPGPSAASRG
jgi:hypothetical protein